MNTDTIRVEGMSCGYCEIAVQDAVRRLPGIKKVKASRRKKQAAVEYDPSRVSLHAIRQAIAGAGYDVADEA